MPVTQHSFHRSLRAALSHTAPASGDDDQASKVRSVIFARGRLSLEPGSVSDTRGRQTDFPWAAAFPPPPPRRGHFRPSFVRRLLRYSAAVRRPSAMAHRRTPIGFSMRSAPEDAEDPGISRFPREMCPRVSKTSAPRTTCTLRRRACISHLNTRPGFFPVNASPTSLRTCTHDSGPS
jgi:hypothetical protein